MLRFLLLTVTACSFIACTAVSTGESLFVVLPDRADSRITASAADHTAVLDVYSASGIGGAKVQWIGGGYPERVLLHFHLRGLEQFRLTYDATAITLAIPSTDQPPSEPVVRQYRSSNASGAGQEQVIAPGSPYWMKTAIIADEAEGQSVIPLTDGWIEVELPPHFIKGRFTGFSMQWVDFFR